MLFRSVVERSVALADSRSIGLGDLPTEVAGAASAPAGEILTLPPEGANLDEILNEVERRLLLSALERTDGNRTAAAKLLGITFRSLRYRLSKHGLGSDDEPTSEDPAGPQ